MLLYAYGLLFLFFWVTLLTLMIASNCRTHFLQDMIFWISRTLFYCKLLEESKFLVSCFLGLRLINTKGKSSKWAHNCICHRNTSIVSRHKSHNEHATAANLNHLQENYHTTTTTMYNYIQLRLHTRFELLRSFCLVHTEEYALVTSILVVTSCTRNR